MDSNIMQFYIDTDDKLVYDKSKIFRCVTYEYRKLSDRKSGTHFRIVTITGIKEKNNELGRR